MIVLPSAQSLRGLFSVDQIEVGPASFRDFVCRRMWGVSHRLCASRVRERTPKFSRQQLGAIVSVVFGRWGRSWYTLPQPGDALLDRLVLDVHHIA